MCQGVMLVHAARTLPFYPYHQTTQTLSYPKSTVAVNHGINECGLGKVYHKVTRCKEEVVLKGGPGN